ncbi:MAG TPA: glycosyl hydrolase [Cytophagales bacterium]|nr:glycosyl hydrolase [Cytophagales bacterium]HAP63167.1 glycosyl hydrolase [Cytophagales bacterium]
MSERHTYEMGLVGNCSYLGYINKDTNVDWMCWPRFDSSFVFGGLLDDEKGGEFSIRPRDTDFTSHQYYIQNTNVLCTEITTEKGSYRVTDFAPRFFQHDRYYKPLMLVRKIEPIQGEVQVRVRCRPTGDYGEITPNTYQGSNHIQYQGLERSLRLTTNISLSYIAEDQFFVLNEAKYLVLTFGQPMEASLAGTVEEFQKKTVNYWRKWAKSTSIGSFYQSAVIRSALVLKIHQYEDTGAIIAAGTTSLPESPGSGRNWDYRYCWMRDTYYTLNAFNNIGHFEELERYFHYIRNVFANSRDQDRLQPLYTISAQLSIEEKIFPLKGYRGNTPVRIGNQASEHIQNDVYGQVLVSLLPLYYDHRFPDEQRSASLDLVREVLDQIEKRMDQPDAGLWEFRDMAYKFCYTYLFHWAGANAAVRIGERANDAEMVTKARKLVDQAAEYIEQCYDDERGVYTQAVGLKQLDASCLQLIMMGYLDPKTERAQQHLRVLEEELRTDEGLFYRYKHEDDFGKPESTFLICSFWYMEALAMVGRVEEATDVFDNVLKYANHLGLLAEDVNEKDGSQWGNYPQAYSHVGLMNAAYRIAKKVDLPSFLV